MKVAVIGAGVAGMCAAIRLKEAGKNNISEVVIFEKNNQPGGLLQSTSYNGYWWDNGAFKFGRANYLVKLLPDAFETFEGYNRKVWRNGRLQNFPFEIKSILSQFSVFALLKLGATYLDHAVKCNFGAGKTTLEEWLQYRLTQRMLEASGLDVYIHKLQGLPLDRISFLFGEQRLQYLHKMTRPGRMFKTIIGRSGKKKAGGVPLVYPRESGVGSIAEKLAAYAEQAGIVVRYGTAVTSISSNGSNLEIAYDGQSGSEIYHADHVISSMPINELAAVCKKRLSPAAVDATRSLRYMDLQMSFFIVKRPFVLSKYLTLYSFEKRHKWKRLVARSLPDETTAVLVETTFDPNQTAFDPDLLDQVERDLTEELGLFSTDEITCRKAAHVAKAYPVYAVGYEEKITALVNELESDNLTTVGRNGRFFYSSTPKIIESARETADQVLSRIIDNRRRNQRLRSIYGLTITR